MQIWIIMICISPSSTGMTAPISLIQIIPNSSISVISWLKPCQNGHLHINKTLTNHRIYQFIELCQTTFWEMESSYFTQINQQVNTNSSEHEDGSITDHNKEQLNIISQYLDLHALLSQDAPLYKQIKNTTGYITVEKGQEIFGAPCISQHFQQENKKTSLFHNFQKHLITTIKTIIKLKHISHSNHSLISIANDLWAYFCDSQKNSKRFLLCLLGKNIIDKKCSLKGIKYYRQYEDILNYFSQYSTQEINSAQSYLYKEIVRQSRSLLQSDKLKIGRMNKPQQFKAYFRKFIQGLEKEDIRHRLPKNVIRQIFCAQESQRNII